MQNNQKAYQLFSSFKNKFYQDDSETAPAVDPLEMDAEMKQLLQKINKQSKKSSATRLKALQQAAKLLESKNEAYFDSFLKVFTIVFEKILTCEEDPKVLLELHRCMRTVLTHGEAAVKKQWGQVFHYLYFATFEPNKELSEVARGNLGVLLKADDKIARSVFLFRDKFFAFVNGMLTNKTEFMANMSIYDDKEVNEIIYRKLVAMVWWAIADMVDKSRHLKPEEREAVFEKIGKVAFDPTQPLSLNIFNGAGDDYVVKTALLYFWSLVLESALPVDKAVLKKVCQTILLNNLDDPNTFFQGVLWRNGFLLRVLELGKSFGVSQEVVTKKFLNLVENHCYSVGGPYYANLPLAARLLIKDESQAKAEQLLKKIIYGHFKSVTKDDLKFDVREHYKVGFRMILDFTLPPKAQGKEGGEAEGRRGMSVKFASAEVFEPINALFFAANNHQQKSLNAISVNLIKFYPLELRKYLAELDQGSDEAAAELRENVRVIIDRVSETTFTQALGDQKAVVNLGLYFKHLVGVDGEPNVESPTIGWLVTSAFRHFAKAFDGTLAKVTDANFSEALTKLLHLYQFAEELAERSVSSLVEKVSKWEPTFPDAFKDFSTRLSQALNRLIVRQEIKKTVFNPSNIDSFSDQLSQFFTLFAPATDVSTTVGDLISYSESHILEIKGGQWQRIASLLLPEEAVKTTKGAIKTLNDDLWGSFLRIAKTKPTKHTDHYKSFGGSPDFWKLYGLLSDAFFANNVLGYSTVLLHYAHQNRLTAAVVLLNRLNNYFDGKSALDLSAQELFKLGFIFEAVKEMPEDHQTYIFESILRAVSKTPADKVEELSGQLKSVLANADMRHVVRFLLIFWELIIEQTTERPETLGLFKRLADFIGKSSKAEESQGLLEDQFGKLLRRYFEAYQDNSHFTTDSFRIVRNKIPQADFTRAVRKTVKEAVATFGTPDSRLHDFLGKLVAQPNLLHNFSSKKQRKFWTEVVETSVLPTFLEASRTDFPAFVRVLDHLLAKSATNYALIGFVKMVIKKSLSNDPFNEETKQRLRENLKAFYDKKISTESDNPSFLFSFKAVLSVVDVRQLFEGPTLTQEVLKAPLTLKKSVLCLQLLRTNSLAVDFASTLIQGVDGADQEGTSLGKILTYQVAYLRDSLSNQHMRPFALALLLEYLDFALEKHEEQIIADNTAILEAEFKSILQTAEAGFSTPFSQNCFHAFLVLLRKLILVLEMFSDSFRNDVFKQISLYSFRVSLGIKEKKFGGTEFWTIPPEDFFDEIAETISRFSIREDTSLAVNEVFELLEIDINSVKRSSYFLVQKFKNPFGVTRDFLLSLTDADNPATALLFQFPKKVAGLVAGKEADDNFTFFLKWAYLLGLCVDQSTQARLNFDVVSKLFTEEKSFYSHLLDRILGHFYDKNMNVREIEDEIRSLDFTNPEKHWGDSVTEETKLAFALHIFFSLTHLFPKNLRSWLETDKQSAIALTILKARVSEAIYLKELDKIELTQHEWKSDDFDVFFNKNTKEVFAVYLKDDTRFEIVLSIPGNYPVKPIGIKVTGSVKISETKETKWKLAITKALMGHNNNIIDALVIWKKTMDAEFAGVDPCSICYSVIHESSKKIPTMGCRTCKKLFHTDCIRQWFASSHKSECPLCKSQFM